MSNAYIVTFLFLLAQLTPPHTLHHLKPLILWPILYSPDKLKKLIFIHHNGSLTHAPTPQQSPSFNTLRKLFRLLSCSVMAVLVICTHPFILPKKNGTFSQILKMRETGDNTGKVKEVKTIFVYFFWMGQCLSPNLGQ